MLQRRKVERFSAFALRLTRRGGFLIFALPEKSYKLYVISYTN